MFSNSLVSRCGLSVAASLMTFAMAGTAMAAYVSTQNANVTGNASAKSSSTILGTSSNESITRQNCSVRRARLGLCNQSVDSDMEAETEINADQTTTATNGVDIDQGSKGDGAATGVQTQGTSVNGNSDADSTAKVTGDSFNYRNVGQECSVRDVRLGLCNPDLETDDEAETEINVTNKTTSTLRRDIRQRNRR